VNVLAGAMSLRQLWRGAVGSIVVLVVFGLPLALSPYGLSVAILVWFFVTLAEGWNLFSGYTGYINFGYAGFVGAGAYGTASAIWRFGLPWPLALLMGALVPVVVSLVALPALRVRGAYFAIAMFGLAETTHFLTASKYLAPLTNGGLGIPLSPGVSVQTQYVLMAATALLTVGLTYTISRSVVGLRLLAVRENETASRVLGINATAYKGLALIASAALAGLAGGIYAIHLAYIDPDAMFSAALTLRAMLMGAFGGLGTVLGPPFGAVLFTLVIQFISTYLLEWNIVVTGVVLMLIVLLIPDGVLPRLQHRFLRLRHRGL
jgi:branched-chain amino acid transport system permease protein